MAQQHAPRNPTFPLFLTSMKDVMATHPTEETIKFMIETVTHFERCFGAKNKEQMRKVILETVAAYGPATKFRNCELMIPVYVLHGKYSRSMDVKDVLDKLYNEGCYRTSAAFYLEWARAYLHQDIERALVVVNEGFKRGARPLHILEEAKQMVVSARNAEAEAPNSQSECALQPQSHFNPHGRGSSPVRSSSTSNLTSTSRPSTAFGMSGRPSMSGRVTGVRTPKSSSSTMSTSSTLPRSRAPPSISPIKSVRRPESKPTATRTVPTDKSKSAVKPREPAAIVLPSSKAGNYPAIARCEVAPILSTGSLVPLGLPPKSVSARKALFREESPPEASHRPPTIHNVHLPAEYGSLDQAEGSGEGSTSAEGQSNSVLPTSVPTIPTENVENCNPLPGVVDPPKRKIVGVLQPAQGFDLDDYDFYEKKVEADEIKANANMENIRNGTNGALEESVQESPAARADESWIPPDDQEFVSGAQFFANYVPLEERDRNTLTAFELKRLSTARNSLHMNRHLSILENPHRQAEREMNAALERMGLGDSEQQQQQSSVSSARTEHRNPFK